MVSPMEMLIERYAARRAGVLSCYDWIIIASTLPGVCYAQGMTSVLNSKSIRIFDYSQFAALLRDRVLDHILNGIRSIGRKTAPSLVACQSGRGIKGRRAHRLCSRYGTLAGVLWIMPLNIDNRPPLNAGSSIAMAAFPKLFLGSIRLKQMRLLVASAPAYAIDRLSGPVCENSAIAHVSVTDKRRRSTAISR